VNVSIHDTVLAAIGAHALRDAPNECCGLLVGTDHLIDEAVPARNVVAHPSRYQIDPQQHIDLNRRLRGTARSVIGAYHSHPRSEATPSPRDLQEAHYPEFIWLIVSLAGKEPRFGAYRMADGVANSLTLTVIVSTPNF
jgi:proteasome lid subunit RPN8/RPN11